MPRFVAATNFQPHSSRFPTEAADGGGVVSFLQGDCMHSLRQRLNARDEGGFTLIELLVVLIIIGVLLAIAIPSYLGFQKKAQQTAAMSDVRSAVPDAVAYYSDNNNYTGVSVLTLQGYDSGLTAYSAGPPEV